MWPLCDGVHTCLCNPCLHTYVHLYTAQERCIYIMCWTAQPQRYTHSAVQRKLNQSGWERWAHLGSKFQKTMMVRS